MSSTQVTIGGINVKFPNKPYPSQISMMDKIIRGLQKKQNCLLESPTGSGKTLSLLCAALAWQITEKQNIIKAETEYTMNIQEKVKSSCFCDCDAKKSKPNLKKLSRKGEICYEDESGESVCSSNNSILSNSEIESNDSYDRAANDCPCVCHGMYNDQLVNDGFNINFKKKVPTIYFATRTHKQIANVIKELRKTPYANEIRMTILSSRQHTCIHPQISKLANKDDLCKKLNKEKSLDSSTAKIEKSITGGCEYMTKLKKQPISYENYGFKHPVWDIEELITSFKRKRLCPYYGARDLKEVVDVILCPYNYLIDPKIRSSMSINLTEQIVIIDEAHNIEDTCRDSASILITRFQLEQAKNEMQPMLDLHPDPQVVQALTFFVEAFIKLIGWIDRNTIEMTQHNFDGAISRIMNGLEIVAEFKMQGIGPEKYELFKSHMSSLSSDDGDEQIISDAARIVINQLCLIMEFLYMENHEYMDDFRVAIIKSKENNFGQNEEESFQPTQFNKFSSQASKPTFSLTIHFWCLNPAVAFYYLRKCHSVVLCSGTLSPMDTFQSELGVKFDNQLEANHVIKDEQVWVGVFGYGPNDVNLLTNYKTCETYAYQDEVGRFVVDICKTVPYGVLCFLPSYTLLNKLFNRWSDNGTLQKIRAHKQIFSETKVSKGFDQLLKDYYDCIDSNTTGDIKEGALLLAVYRGRASEGLDFSDNYARAVVAIGIPYPNVKDVQVDLKRKYNNSLCNKKKLLNGDEWYEIQAYRALNQSLGRCIRHINDWGAIILVDDRYLKQPEKYSKGLSKWIRKKFKTYRNYSEGMNSLKGFTEKMKEFKGVVNKPSLTQVEEPNKETTTAIMPSSAPCQPDFNKPKFAKNISEKKSSCAFNDSPSAANKSNSKKRIRNENNEWQNSSTPNLNAFKYQNTQNKLSKKSSDSMSNKTNSNWVNINDSIVVESDNEEAIEIEQKKSEISSCDLVDDEEEDDFAILKKEKKRKFNNLNLNSSNQSPTKSKSNSADDNEIVDRSIEELDFDFDENLDLVSKERKKFNKK